jgi:hypothetical protein
MRAMANHRNASHEARSFKNAMPENQNDPKTNGLKHRLAGAIGGGLGGAAAFAVCKLIGSESFWVGVVLVAGCAGIGGFLAQKIVSK